jgi:hypothetical protein
MISMGDLQVFLITEGVHGLPNDKKEEQQSPDKCRPLENAFRARGLGHFGVHYPTLMNQFLKGEVRSGEKRMETTIGTPLLLRMFADP